MIGGILRTSDRPSRNIDRVISGYLRSGMSHSYTLFFSVICADMCKRAGEERIDAASYSLMPHIQEREIKHEENSR